MSTQDANREGLVRCSAWLGVAVELGKSARSIFLRQWIVLAGDALRFVFGGLLAKGRLESFVHVARLAVLGAAIPVALAGGVVQWVSDGGRGMKAARADELPGATVDRDVRGRVVLELCSEPGIASVRLYLVTQSHNGGNA